jgi:hypothetical protein
MSSAGHVFDMIRRMRGNRAELHSQKPGFRDNIEIKERRRTFLQFEKVSDSELSSLKKKIRYKASLEKRRVFIISLIVITLFLLAYVWLLFWR